MNSADLRDVLKRLADGGRVLTVGDRTFWLKDRGYWTEPSAMQGCKL